MKEEIKDLKESSDYLISNLGYIISKERTYNNGKSDTAIKPEKILKISDGGYVSIILPDKSVINKRLIEFVASNFLEIPKKFSSEFYSVFTKDGNYHNANINNVYYDINDMAIRTFDLEGNWLGDYPTVKSFTEITDVALNSIYKVCSGGQISADSYQFRYLKTYGIENVIKSLPSTIGKRRSDTVPVAKYWGAKLVCVYNSITEAAENNDLPVEKVWEGYERNKAIKGFTFKKAC